MLAMNKGIKYVLFVGLNDKDTKRQIIPTDRAQTIVNDIIYTLSDGATVYSAYGVYKHANGVKVLENTIKIELTDCTENTILNVIKALKEALNQESIMIEKHTSEYNFI